jgi:hypothetical protein
MRERQNTRFATTSLHYGNPKEDREEAKPSRPILSTEAWTHDFEQHTITRQAGRQERFKGCAQSLDQHRAGFQPLGRTQHASFC